LNIYVGNLPRTTDEDTVRHLFEEYGEISEVKLLKDHYSGELRGFGFVTMPSDDEAQNAIDALNGYELEGRSLVVNKARPRRENTGGGRNNYRGGGGGGYQGGGNRSRSW
jgi:RNA recognition motif-containing protein